MMKLCSSLAASAFQVHPELVSEQKTPAAYLALAATMMFTFDQDTPLLPESPHRDYNGGYVPVYPSSFAINLMDTHPKNPIHQSRRCP